MSGVHLPAHCSVYRVLAARCRKFLRSGPLSCDNACDQTGDPQDSPLQRPCPLSFSHNFQWLCITIHIRSKDHANSRICTRLVPLGWSSLLSLAGCSQQVAKLAPMPKFPDKGINSSFDGRNVPQDLCFAPSCSAGISLLRDLAALCTRVLQRPFSIGFTAPILTTHNKDCSSMRRFA